MQIPEEYHQCWKQFQPERTVLVRLQEDRSQIALLQISAKSIPIKKLKKIYDCKAEYGTNDCNDIKIGNR